MVRRYRQENRGEIPRRILIVEDHIEVASRIDAILERRCQVIGIAHNGKAAADVAVTLKPDVMVLDISLRLLNGREITRRLKVALPDVDSFL